MLILSHWCCLPKLTLSQVCSSVLSRRNLHKPRPQSFYHADVLRSSTLVPAPRTTTNPWEHLGGRLQSFAKAFSFLFFRKKASENEKNLGKRLLSPDVHWCARPVKLNQAEEREEGGRTGRGTKWNSEPKWEEGGGGGRKLASKQVLIFWREKYILRVYGGIQLILV